MHVGPRPVNRRSPEASARVRRQSQRWKNQREKGSEAFEATALQAGTAKEASKPGIPRARCWHISILALSLIMVVVGVLGLTGVIGRFDMVTNASLTACGGLLSLGWGGALVWMICNRRPGAPLISC